LGDPSAPVVQEASNRRAKSGMSTLPLPLRLALRDECIVSMEEIKRQMRVWEDPNNASNLKDRPEIGRTVKQLREQLDKEISDLLDIDNHANADGVALPQKIVEFPTDQPIWLEFSFSNENYKGKYFYCPQLGKLALQGGEVPEGACISELSDLADRIQHLRERLAPLKKQRSWKEAARNSAGAVSQVQTPTVAPVGHTAAGELSAHSTEAHPFHATRFGGDEAVDPNAINDHMDTTAAAAQTFHPRRDGRIESQRALGKTPWAIFGNVTKVLVLVWFCGMVYSIYVAFYVECLYRDEFAIVCNKEKEKKEKERDEDVGLLTLDSEKENVMVLNGTRVVPRVGIWPDSFSPINAVGLACDKSSEISVFLLARYVVHDIAIHPLRNEMSPAKRSSAIHSCLSHVPNFHSDGLASMSVECPDSKVCAAILLSAEGNKVLICPLGRDSAEPTVVTLPGRSWKSLSTDHSGHSRQWWGLSGTRGSLSKLVEHKRKQNDVYRLMRSRSSKEVGFRSISVVGGKVLGLSANGEFLRAWSGLTSSEMTSIGKWQLPASVRWKSICATEHHIFAVANSDDSNAPAILPDLWRFDLPTELKRCA